jgi:hypothetical protein
MTNQSFFEDDSTLLTSGAFPLVLASELKRAIRAKYYLTLVVVEMHREWEGMSVPGDTGTVQAVAQIISREIRDTDLRAQTDEGTLTFVLIDCNFEDSTRVIDRVVLAMKDHGFPTSFRVDVGAACYPTHAVDGGSLKQQALSHPLVSWRVQ